MEASSGDDPWKSLDAPDGARRDRVPRRQTAGEEPRRPRRRVSEREYLSSLEGDLVGGDLAKGDATKPADVDREAFDEWRDDLRKRAESLQMDPSADDEPRKVAAAPKKKPRAVSSANRFITLELSGRLRKTALDSKDPQTWARLAHFVSAEAPSRCFLVYPDGSVPVAMKVGADGKPQPVRPSRKGEDRKAPSGDPLAPSFKIVLKAKTRSDGEVAFYGKLLGGTYQCTIRCSVLERRGSTFVPMVDEFSVTRSVPAGGGEGKTIAEWLRLAYDATLEELARELRSTPPFERRRG